MKRCLLRCLKAGLIGLVLVVINAWAADAPKMTADQNLLNPNSADVGLVTTINFNNHVDLQVNPGGQGCHAGQWWDVKVGGCTAAVQLRTQSTSRACNCACPGKGSCTSSQTGSYPVFGWRLPTAGNELFSHNGATSWNACTIVTNSCVADDDSGGNNGGSIAPGQTLLVKILVCGPGDLNYASGPLDATWKSKIISSYRSFNYGGRCPEPGGFISWQNQIISDAAWKYPELSKSNPAEAYSQAWSTWTRQLMTVEALKNREDQPSYLSILDSWCAGEIRKINPKLNGKYVNQSGNICIAQ